MAGKKKMKERQDGMFEKLFSNTLSLVINFIFSVALVGGASYLIFTLQTEEDDLVDSWNHAQNQIEEVKAWNQMLGPVSGGWFDDEQNLKNFFLILEILRLDVQKEKLEAASASTITDWCSKTLMILASEKGQ